MNVKCVIVTLSINLFIGCWGYTLIERTELISGETSVTVCIAVSTAVIVGKFNTGTERERVKENTRKDSG
jgi:hypothetical protein